MNEKGTSKSQPEWCMKIPPQIRENRDKQIKNIAVQGARGNRSYRGIPKRAAVHPSAPEIEMLGNEFQWVCGYVCLTRSSGTPALRVALNPGYTSDSTEQVFKSFYPGYNPNQWIRISEGGSQAWELFQGPQLILMCSHGWEPLSKNGVLKYFGLKILPHS